ncbi:3-hydroxyacyl-CoA dehydrogenase [Haematospirillum jordaniae]|uniref:3-hydroxyacyl-CoA dehydrogenase n=1 Tax=Haematospirillum jordaniae TaxID=1549855 RepID=A0A143DFV9_9PROT|nr:3-hydroxyacyl-CoA dehydrogenase/enoyl-CoA hydratase family protein [Haematospirillum jordaniae]AMW34988.1 3-hydroxyacyl-CoA dehydrogenase [Haematospirillum jordaniae]NKD44282.1 3-hydroxyacyl-CoA dehydrogenase [Haematospirillum jordaniae]NKD56661.1 3-hydroxyacyl-CoA dehydrogenase [Haematospirillum jordaniae]NKD58719.1 3-hydroxyacyl-CoA dehydrogenase [Haematospirillum jordaniae]NKD66112.1 3-hydroxyacyl-CoA dehydrogenase [Haematospirillum jordaniae]
MATPINKVAVIGAGVMGAGIAAHIANAGIPVVLLDIVPADAENRNVIAETAVQKMLKADPAPFMTKGCARNIQTGNLEDDLPRLADCDWIIEAVVERLDIKQDLYRKLDSVRKKGCIVSSNTSTIPLESLTKGLSDAFARDFCITHFFNPPRYMRLLEVVRGPQTRAEAIDAVSTFCDLKLGKSVVHCQDRPGFIGNRLGILWILAAVVEAMDNDISIEEADAILGRPFGIPKTGVFGLMDLVGLDLMPHILQSMLSLLPKTDAFHVINRDLALIRTMIADGYTGRKGKGGFYRINRTGTEKIKEGIDLKTGQYRVSAKPQLASLDAAKEAGKKAGQVLLSHPDKGGRYARRVMARTLSYAASLIPDVTASVDDIDEAMRLGYNWKFGPFQLADQIGPDALIAILKQEGMPVPAFLETASGKSFYQIENGRRMALSPDGSWKELARPDGVVLLEDIKRTAKPLLKNGSASLWDIGDGVACLEFTSKMNSLDPEILKMISQTVRFIPKNGFKALLVYNEGSNFSVGANLGLAIFAANIAAWPMIEEMVENGQKAYMALKRAPFPVVGAPSGMALGGGCEILLHCDAVQAHAETYMGLVEVGVGLIPGWGGCKEMLHRLSIHPALPKGPMPPVAKAFETISTATVAKSAMEAKERGFLRDSDGITMNRYRLLADAKAKALAMVQGYKPAEPIELKLPGETGKVAMEMALGQFRRMGKATPYDEVVSLELANILSGGETDHTETLTEDNILALERSSFMRLVRQKGTLDRVEHMLLTGKPLRN